MEKVSEETLKDILEAFAESGNEPDKRTLSDLANASERSIRAVIQLHDEARINLLPK